MAWLCGTKIWWKSKTVLYWYRQFLCIIVYIKIDYLYKETEEDVQTRFVTSNCELDKPLAKKKKKVIELMKDELGAKIITKFVGLRAKTYSYLIDDSSEDKKGKDTIKCVIKRKGKF